MCDFACQENSTTILMRDASSSMKDILDAATFPATHEKYRKSSYRDISKDFCAEKTIKLKRLKSPRYPRCNLACHLRKTTDPLSLQEKRKLPCRIECLNDSVKPAVGPVESFPLLITDRQGLVEIHISRLQLSTSVAKIPNEEDICSLHIYVSWDVWGEKTAYTPRMKCPNLIFNSSSVYRIADLFTFFKNVLSEHLVFRVNVARRDCTSYTLARAKVSIKDILDYPQNKLHYIVPVNSVISSLFGVNFGQLSLWVRLSCNVDMVEAFKKQCGISSSKDALYTPPVEEEERNILPQKPLPRRPTRHIVDTVPLKDEQQKDSLVSEGSMDRNTQPSTSSKFQNHFNSDDENDYSNNEESSSSINEISEMSKETGMTAARSPDSKPDNNKRKESNALRDLSSMAEFRTFLANGTSLSEGSGSTICDVGEVLSDRDWERYKRKSLLTFPSTLRAISLNVEAQDYRNDTSTCSHEKDAIIIEIVSMRLLDESYVMRDDEIHLLYVEYSFLGNRGEDMETVSLEKPKTADQEMVYNYKKKFWINEVTHPMQRDSLRAMLAETTSPDINFTILSEPLPKDREIKDCEEIGLLCPVGIPFGSVYPDQDSSIAMDDSNARGKCCMRI